MIIPCIDLMDRKVVQLVQGKEKFLELPEPLAVLEKFSAYPEIQVIDLDAAMGKAENNAEIVRELCRRKPCRVGGGIRSTARAQAVVGDGALKAIVGSSAFTSQGINQRIPARARRGRAARENPDRRGFIRRSRGRSWLEGNAAAHLRAGAAPARTLLFRVSLHLHRWGRKIARNEHRLVSQFARRYPTAHYRGGRNHHGRRDRSAGGTRHARRAGNVHLPQSLPGVLRRTAARRPRE